MKLLIQRLNKELSTIREFTNRYYINLKKDNINIYFENIIRENPTVKVSLVLNDNYPFSCPIVYINDKEYLDLLKSVCNIDKYKYKNNCIYCNSIVCPDKWKPAKKIKDILKEIIDNKSYFINL